MKKIIINYCYGRFDLSIEALDFMGIKINDWPRINRNDPAFRENPKLVECVETLGDRVDTDDSRLAIEEIPDNAEWKIVSDNGWEEIIYHCKIDVDKLMSLKTRDDVIKYLDENGILHN